MNNQTIANRFSERATTGHSLNMFIDGDTIYSYGYHFPMARHTNMEYNNKPVVIFTRLGYSVTTARHLSHTRSSLNDYHVVSLEHPSSSGWSYLADGSLEFNKVNVDLTYKALTEEMTEYSGKRDRARTDHMHDFWERERKQAFKDRAELMDLYNIYKS